MKKEKFTSLTIDPKVSTTWFLMDMADHNGCSIQVAWSGLTAASAINIDLQVQQSNDGVHMDDIAPFFFNITSAADSVTFEHNAFEAAACYLKVTATDCTGGTMECHNVRRVMS